MDVRWAMQDDRPRPAGEEPDSSLTLVKSLLQRELDALATFRSSSDGLRLRVLTRMADRTTPAA